MKVGDKVIWHTGFYGAEQGQHGMTWWTQDKKGKVKRIKKNKVLISFSDGSREWADLARVEKIEADDYQGDSPDSYRGEGVA